MNRSLGWWLLLSLLAFYPSQELRAQGKITETSTHRFTEVGKGIYLAQTTARLFNSNALVVVNRNDVLVVDSHITPTKGRELIQSIGVLTDNPITTLVNSHFHYDHSHGNQAFTDGTFPFEAAVEIIGHEFTRKKMMGKPLSESTFQRGLAGNEAYVKRLKRQIGESQNELEREELQNQLRLISSHLAEWSEIQPVAPTTAFNDRLVLFRGQREIQLHFFGRAHTGGDIVIYFPGEKLAFTGDMMLAGPSWLGDGYVDEWVETLENLKTLDIRKIVPGHGVPFSEIGRIDTVQSFYRDLWKKTKSLYEQGVSAEDAASSIDMTNHEKSLGISRPGYDLFAIERMYRRMRNGD